MQLFPYKCDGVRHAYFEHGTPDRSVRYHNITYYKKLEVAFPDIGHWNDLFLPINEFLSTWTPFEAKTFLDRYNQLHDYTLANEPGFIRYVLNSLIVEMNLISRLQAYIHANDRIRMHQLFPPESDLDTDYTLVTLILFCKLLAPLFGSAAAHLLRQHVADDRLEYVVISSYLPTFEHHLAHPKLQMILIELVESHLKRLGPVVRNELKTLCVTTAGWLFERVLAATLMRSFVNFQFNIHENDVWAYITNTARTHLNRHLRTLMPDDLKILIGD